MMDYQAVCACLMVNDIGFTKCWQKRPIPQAEWSHLRDPGDGYSPTHLHPILPSMESIQYCSYCQG